MFHLIMRVAVRDWSHDLVLGALQNLEEPVGRLIQAFPGRAGLATNPDWLDEWFVDSTKKIARGRNLDAKRIIASAAEHGELSVLGREPVKARVRLKSIRPVWFRGFRAQEAAISFDGDLVVVEGRNSSGKTSLSEAMEWVLTGSLSRRTSGSHGNARELADCIGNEFRPVGEATAVELELLVDGVPARLKRVLRRDYSTTASENAESDFLYDGNPLRPQEERIFLERLFAGVHPILMQHNLHRFVHADPAERREYFERLLQIDELTALIEKAVIGPARLKQLPNPSGGAGLAAFESLLAELGQTKAAMDLRKADRIAVESIPDYSTSALVKIAQEVSPTLTANTIGEYRDLFVEAQREQREAKLPLLSALDAARHNTAPSCGTVIGVVKALLESAKRLVDAQSRADMVTEAEKHISRAAHLLAAGNLIRVDTSELQQCPVCAHDPKTLGSDRLRTILSWHPLTAAVDKASVDEQSCRDAAMRETERFAETVDASLPKVPDKSAVDRQLSKSSPRIQELGRNALLSASLASSVAQGTKDAIGTIRAYLNKTVADDSEIEKALLQLNKTVDELIPCLATHREDVGHLEEAVAAASRDDSGYRLREKWLTLSGLITALQEDIVWERAKLDAKASLDALRDGLIALRTEIIEHARETFSRDITKVWHFLRSDSGARFSQIVIPEARGRGYKLEFELKALISDGTSDSEVDVLRVFSESQVNVIGIAAYVTRAKLLGHKLLIFDDPVQSMDEEHFRTFAANLLPTLLDEGHQVLILTHSDTFARRIHDQHFQRSSYVTLETRATKRLGCKVLEGNRRVSERLKNALRCADNGDLQEAWRLVRLAVERLYVLVFARGTQGFDPESWRNLTAEDMWERGVDVLIEANVPGAGKRLKEILQSTVAGAHDVAASSETDLRETVTFIRSLLSPLRLGDG